MSAFTPVIKRLNPSGTTFYTFSSAARDLSKCLANNDKEFVFSHFVCLDLPDIINPNRNTSPDAGYQGDSSSYARNQGNYSQNYLQLLGLDSMNTRCSGVQTTSAIRIAELMQGYMFNMEELLILVGNDNDTDRSVAERVFWHFLKEIGAVNWENGDNYTAQSLLDHNEKRFAEGCGSVSGYKPVVKYIGQIDITNNVDIEQEAYTEVYVHIPSEAGNTPHVLFKQVFDGNFEAGSSHNTLEVNSNGTYILGQTAENPTYDDQYTDPSDLSVGLTYEALYDGQQSYDIAQEVTGDPQTSQHVNTQAWLLKTDIDGMCIDFEANSYKEIVEGAMVTMDDYNKCAWSESFEFNAVLVYYDIVDRSSGTRTSNLYGILFLDDVHSDTIWDYFQRYPKYKPIQNVQNGNSYGFKLNLRIDIEPNKQGITTLVNEYNTFSMSLFSDAMTRMLQSADMFTRMNNSMVSMNERLTDLENVLLFMTNYNSIVAKVLDLERSVENANLAFADRNTLIDLIAKNSDDINSIVRGRLTDRLQYNTDIIHKGYGVDIDSSVPNEIVIKTKNNGYNLPTVICDSGVVNSQVEHYMSLNEQDRENNNVIFRLMEATNMVRMYVVQNTPAAYDIVFYIDDTFVSWCNGQTVRIVFDNMTMNELHGHNIVMKTDALDKSGNGAYSCGLVIPASELGDRPIIEIVCVNQTLTGDSFVYDIIR